MDPLIRKRCITSLKVHPYAGQQRGDKTFGEPYELDGYINYRESTSFGAASSDAKHYTYIIIDGNQPTPGLVADIVGHLKGGHTVPVNCLNLPDGTCELSTGGKLEGRFILESGKIVQFANIKNEDEIELPGVGRVPVIRLKAYQGLTKGTQNIEVVV